MKKFFISVFLVSLLAASALAEVSAVGRYQILPAVTVQGSSVSILLDTATGKTWKYFIREDNTQGWQAIPIYEQKNSN